MPNTFIGSESPLDLLPLASWPRRAAGYLLRIVLPWSLLHQLLGTLIAGNAWPEGPTGQFVAITAWLIVIAASATLSVAGQPWTHRLLGLVIYDNAGNRASRSRIAARELAHLLDEATLGLGFLWPLWDRHRQTFADKITGTHVRLLR